MLRYNEAPNCSLLCLIPVLQKKSSLLIFCVGQQRSVNKKNSPTHETSAAMKFRSDKSKNMMIVHLRKNDSNNS